MGFTWARRVRLDDTDRFDIVFYGRVFVWMQWAGEELFEAAGCAYHALVEDTGVQFPIVATDAEFRRPIRWGEPVEIDLTAALGETSIRLDGAGRVEGEDAFDVSRTQVAVDLDTGEPAPVPAAVREALEPYAPA